jgi:hypothetical protein
MNMSRTGICSGHYLSSDRFFKQLATKKIKPSLLLNREFSETFIAAKC